eukprot:jgi/Botrbrau1/1603/Bobra.0185s0018.1
MRGLFRARSLVARQGVFGGSQRLCAVNVKPELPLPFLQHAARSCAVLETPDHSEPWKLYCWGVFSFAAAALLSARADPAACEELPKGITREITKEEVALHKTSENRIWVTYKDGVYDITDFVELHPGGTARIMLAAGGPIDPFWALYAQHVTDEVHEILQEYYIGKLVGGALEVKDVNDPYAGDPERHPALIARMQKPYNGETPPEILASTPFTPNTLFYVRNHLPVPTVDAETWKVRIEGPALEPLELSLKDLKTKFKEVSIPVTLQCSGNRRNEMSEVKHVKGLEWDAGAISTAVFTGVRLADVLAHAGLTEENAEKANVRHVQFEGLDRDIEGTTYGASVPVDRALNPYTDILLAWAMNGEELPLDHGYPVRVVVPGVTAARSVKWVSRILASDVESPSHWQQRDYKTFSPSVDWDNVDWDSAPAIQESNVQSAIVEPKPGSSLEGPLDEVEVRGFAYSGGGKGIIRVDVSADGGKSWITANLHPVDSNLYRAWAWTLWDAVIPLPQGFEGPLELVCKATDASCNTQPESAAPIWNLRGVMNNSWHTSKVKVSAN